MRRRNGIARLARRVRRFSAWGPAALLCLALSSCALPGSGAGSGTDTITFGVTVPITGERAAEGQYSLDGYRFYVNAINRQGGMKVGGRRYRVALKYYDDQSQPQRTAALYRKLIVDDKVTFLLGPYSSLLTAAAAPVAERYGIPMVAPHGSAEAIYARGFKDVFSIVSPAKNYLRGIIAVVLARDPQVKTLALLGENEPFSREAIAGAAEYARTSGMRVVARLSYPSQPSSVAAQLLAIKRAHPDLLLAAGHLQDSILITRQARDLCLAPRAMGFSVGPSLPAFRANLGSEANYVFGATQWTSDLRYRGDDQWGTPKAFARAFRAAYPGYDQVPYQAAESAAALVAFQHALQAAGSLDRTAVRGALARLDFMTFYGRIKFDSRGVNVYKPMAVVQLQPGGKTDTVFPVDVATSPALYPMPPLCA
ncbi:MAG: amino acid ABC transporter substrate-binding protein [Chloroflexi bacterium]|nr:amino acid ABC transporter substrate-binding protein [Chloroflexota bacterium]